MSNRLFVAAMLFSAACTAEPQEPAEATVLAEVALASGATYRFVGVPDEDGTLANIGLMEASPAGTRSIQDVGEARGLDAVSVFRALTPADVEPPAALVEVAARAGGTTTDQPRGWLAQQLAVSNVALFGGCDNAWFGDRHGPNLFPWEHGWNALDRRVDTDPAGQFLFAQTSWGTEEWRSGVCIQEQDSWYDRTQIRYHVKNCASCNFVGAGSVPDGVAGGYHTYTWIGGTASKQFHFDVRAYDLNGGFAYGVYDLGLNWND